MYWPDYGPRKKRSSSWRKAGTVFVLVFIVFAVGAINGWWQIILSPRAFPDDAVGNAGNVASTVVAETISSAPPTATVPAAKEAASVAPLFELPGLFDESQTIALSNYSGRPIILNFWASWSAPCRVEMPALQQVYQQYRDQGLVVLGINQLHDDSREAAQRLIKELRLTFPNAADDTGEVSRQRYHVIGLPTSVFINTAGQIAHVQIGQMSAAQIERYSQELIGEGVVNP